MSYKIPCMRMVQRHLRPVFLSSTKLSYAIFLRFKKEELVSSWCKTPVFAGFQWDSVRRSQEIILE